MSGVDKLLAALGGDVDHEAQHVCVLGEGQPRWDEDPVVLTNGWNTPNRCPRCGNTAPAAVVVSGTEPEEAR